MKSDLFAKLRTEIVPGDWTQQLWAEPRLEALPVFLILVFLVNFQVLQGETCTNTHAHTHA